MAKSKNSFIYTLLNDEVHNIAKLAYPEVKEFKYTSFKVSERINIECKLNNGRHFILSIDNNLDIFVTEKLKDNSILSYLPNSMKVHKYIIGLSNKWL